MIDFDVPANNDWLAVNQLTVAEGQHTRRPDVVLFVNGLPLAVIELKNPADENATVWSAYQQLQTYQAQIPALFATNAVLVASDGVQARIGALDAGKEWLKPWRTITGREDAAAKLAELQVVLEGVFAQGRFLELVRYFIVFEDSSSEGSSGKLIKKMAGYHQFHAVNVAVEETLRAAKVADKAAYGNDHAALAGRNCFEQIQGRRERLAPHTTLQRDHMGNVLPRCLRQHFQMFCALGEYHRRPAGLHRLYDLVHDQAIARLRVHHRGAQALELDPFVVVRYARRQEAGRAHQNVMRKRPLRRLPPRIHAIAHGTALHEDDRMTPVLSRHGCGQAGDELCLRAPRHEFKAARRDVVTLVHYQMSIIGHQIAHCTRPPRSRVRDHQRRTNDNAPRHRSPAASVDAGSRCT